MLIKILYNLINPFLSPENRARFLKKRGILNCGNNCSIFKDVGFGSEPYLIIMGDNVKITNGVRFVTHDGGVHVIRNKYNMHNIDKFGTIVIGNNVFIGINSIIMPNVVIGNNVVIGAGSIVTRDIPNNTIVCGIPAKEVKNIEEYYVSIKDDLDNTKMMYNAEKKRYLTDKYFNKKIL